MFYKYYAANVSKDGVVVGSRIVKVHFWRSPFFAFQLMDSVIPPDKTLIDFKRVK